MEEIRSFDKVDVVTELRCIEGWSTVVHWTGARFADFIAKYPPATRSGDPPDVHRRPDDLMEYVSLKTPDEGITWGWIWPVPCTRRRCSVTR